MMRDEELLDFLTKSEFITLREIKKSLIKDKNRLLEIKVKSNSSDNDFRILFEINEDINKNKEKVVYLKNIAERRKSIYNRSVNR